MHKTATLSRTMLLPDDSKINFNKDAFLNEKLSTIFSLGENDLSSEDYQLINNNLALIKSGFATKNRVSRSQRKVRKESYRTIIIRPVS